MDNDSPLRRTLNRITDTLVVGLLITVCSLPVVTAFASLKAGAAVLADSDASGSLVGRFAAGIRSGFRESILLGVIFAAAAGVGCFDLAVAMTSGLGAVTIPVEAAGLGLMLATAVLPGWAAGFLRQTPNAGTRAVLRHAVLTAAARPAWSGALLGLVLSGLVATAITPVLFPAAAGAIALLAARLPALTLTMTPSPNA